MKATVWGARGSIPVSGRQYLKYGGDTTCLQIEAASGHTIIIDAGTGIRPLGNQLLRRGGPIAVHFLLTHCHWDHLMGFPFFRPLYRDDTILRFCGCRFAQDSIRAILRETMKPPFFPVDFHDVSAELQYRLDAPNEFDIGSIHCRRFPLNHPNDGCGFLLTEDGKTLAFFPDNELHGEHEGGPSYAEFARTFTGVDVLVHDGEYKADEYRQFARGYGHSVFTETVDLAMEAGVRRLIMWHINQDRTDEVADQMLVQARTRARAAGSSLRCDIAATGMTLEL